MQTQPNILVSTLLFLSGLAAAAQDSAFTYRGSHGNPHPPVLVARVVAVGIPGASAISGVGTFLPGGPIHDNPEFAAFTAPGRVIDPTRILVGSRSNFGAPLADREQEDGSFLSIESASAEILVVPPRFAARDGQASALGGRVQMFSANSPAFLNGINTPGAVTADFTGVSNPLGISINNAFGRFWPANAPYGLQGIGTSTILDPTGIPLAGAPKVQAGGVFVGDLTPRLPTQRLPGEESADFYVANRGDNTIVRMRQDGTVVAVRRVAFSGGRSLGTARLNGIAVSPDGSKIWVTVTAPGNCFGAVLELPAFRR